MFQLFTACHPLLKVAATAKTIFVCDPHKNMFSNPAVSFSVINSCEPISLPSRQDVCVSKFNHSTILGTISINLLMFCDYPVQ